MPASLIPYEFTEDDAAKLEAMGYVFTGISKKDLPGFINRNYYDFNLGSLLEEAEKLMLPLAGAFSTITRFLIVRGTDLEIGFNNNHNGDEDIALIFDRSFYRESGILKVEHSFLVFPKPARGQKLSKKVLKLCLEHYRKLGVETITITAGLSAGAFTWGRAGFVAINRGEVEDILHRARMVLNPVDYRRVETIFQEYYSANPNGEDFPMEDWAYLACMEPVLMDAKSQWHGRLDLTNQEHLSNFEDYVNR